MTAQIGKSQGRSPRTIKQIIEERPFTNERWLRRLVYERRIAYSKVGGKVLIDLEDLDALVENGRVEAAS